MLKKIVQRIVSHPWIYDHVQRLLGLGATYERLAAQAATVNPAALVLDLGGGTGLYRNVWSSDCIYLCLDVDVLKLQHFLRKNPDGSAILGDATCIPIKDNSIDVAVCIAVAHHLSNASLAELVRESHRTLKATGTFLFVDAVWVPRRWSGRMLWRYDRGSYPRSAEYLRSVLSEQYHLVHSERYAVHHEYVLYRGVKHAKDDAC